jgi:4-hydroxy-tetrahydrodipicolinate reductase
VGAVVAANFSLGANVLEALAETAGRLLGGAEGFGAFVHEAHHAAKKDAPSGTALALRRAVERGGFARGVDMSSTRAGFIPGTHRLGFDGQAETLELIHSVRDRATFAHGALAAARWVVGRRGWFTMRDVLMLGSFASPRESASE